MFIAKIYGAIWILSILTFLVVFLTGLLSTITLIAFGMYIIGLLFIGMIGVLPSMTESFMPPK